MTASTALKLTGHFDAETVARLEALPARCLSAGTTLFSPGEEAQGFVIMIEGRIEVFLVGPSGREILLYAVEPGSSCVQSTLGLLGGEEYSGEAIAATACRLIVVPRTLFLQLMNSSETFRLFVFSTFAIRMQTIMHLLERVAFQRIESRLARELAERADDGLVRATHQDLATAIGSAREVVSRRLEAFARAGWIHSERGEIAILDRAALQRLSATGDSPTL